MSAVGHERPSLRVRSSSVFRLSLSETSSALDRVGKSGNLTRDVRLPEAAGIFANLVA